MRDMITMGFPSRPQPVPLKPDVPPARTPARRNPSSRTTSPATIAALPGVKAVIAEQRNGPLRHTHGVDEPNIEWLGVLLNMIDASAKVGDLAAHIGDHLGLRALTRGEWSIAVVFDNTSPISKSLIRAMRTCLDNLNAGRVKP